MVDKEERTTVGQNSKVSVAILLVTISASGGGAAWATSVNNRLSNIEAHIAKPRSDNWTESDMKAWSAELGNRNPEIVVPAAEHRFIKDG